MDRGRISQSLLSRQRDVVGRAVLIGDALRTVLSSSQTSSHTRVHATLRPPEVTALRK